MIQSFSEKEILMKRVLVILCSIIIAAHFYNFQKKSERFLIAADEEPLQVFILAGQSNMVGVGAKELLSLPKEMQAAQESVLFAEYWADDFKPLLPKNNIGPEVSFGYEMSKALKKKIALAKLAVGGTSIEVDWNPSEYNKEKSIGSLYKRLTEYVSSLKSKHKNIKIVGLLWMQGEADSRYHAKSVDQYKLKLEKLIDNFRKEFDSPDMFFICGRINTPADWPYRKNVRDAQESIKKKGYAWIDCDDLELGPDKLHFTLKGQVEIGKKYAEKMLTLMGKTSKVKVK